ncbi:glycosyltransferase [Pedobacter agri]|uniref:glycosyltransferase n=1 Tax=Pedobacter agri TaxID=454586 RepID=UPI002930C606|nr:glycosyltransferase [Pedobacter agri]
MKSTKGACVIICTFNGEMRLEKTLNHLAQQEFTNLLECELIVVDNNSSDNTRQITLENWNNYSLTWTSFRVIEEHQPGLSFARQKGIDEANYEYIIFCDDDNWLDKNYVETAFNIISGDPKIAALGGQSTATASIAIPDWFEGSKSNYAVGQQADETGDVTSREFLWGSGIVIRKSIYQLAYQQFPSLLTGRKGQTLSAGEDSEMCLRFMIMGYRLYYSDQLKFQHFISEERLTPQYNDNLRVGFVQAYEILKLYSAFYHVHFSPLKRKLALLIKAILKKILSKPLLGEEKLNLYNLFGWEYEHMDKNFRLIKAFAKSTPENQ